MTTFKLADVALGRPLERAVETDQSIRALVNVTPEAFGSNQDNLKALWIKNGFLNTIHTAFDQHLPLVLSPDDVWVAIAQGFANHVNANAEDLRYMFVQHEGKKNIEIQRDGFRKGSPDNDWMGGFSEFSDKIAEYIGKKRDLIVSEFSTTGLVERAASEVVLMDAMQSYFSYSCRTACGIPNVTLLGTVEDWSKVEAKAAALSEFKCEEWIKVLSPVLAQFTAAAQGNPDLTFWKSIYKDGGGSGGPYVSGWVNAFFPYLAKGRKNRDLSGTNYCNHTDAYPSGLSSVPFVWHYFATDYEMQFLGGFVGMSQDPSTLAVRPALGWAVADKQ